MNFKITVSAHERYEVMKDVIGLRKRSVEDVYFCDTYTDALEIADIIKSTEFAGDNFINRQITVVRS